MRADADTRRHNPPRRPRSACRRSILILIIAVTAGALAGCGMSPDWNPTPEATIIPLTLPTRSKASLSAEAQYSDLRRHAAITSFSFASMPAGAILPPAPSGESEHGVSLLLDSGTTIKGELFKAGGEAKPAILILGAEARAWGDLPHRLSQAGFVVLALETAAATPARHIDLMLQSLIAIPGVDAGAIGLVGEARSADLAMLGCAVNTLCDALALFSPTSRATLLNMLSSFGARPLWLSASRSESASHAAALSLSQALPGQAQFVELESGYGAGLLDSAPGLAEQLVLWFALHLQDNR